MANINNNTTRDGLPPDMGGKPSNSDSDALVKDCVLNKDGEYVVIRPVRDKDTKEIINYSLVRKITEADLNNKDLIPADWSPKGKLSLKQAQKQLHEELVDYFNNQKAMDDLFNSISKENDRPLTKQSDLDDLLASSEVPIEEKLINASLFGINVEDPNGSGRKVNLRDVYYQEQQLEKSNAIIQSYIDSKPTVREKNNQDQTDFPKSVDNFLHCRKDSINEYSIPNITKNPANKAKSKNVYLGSLFNWNPLFDGSCTEMISSAKADNNFELPEHREEEIAQGVNIIGGSGKSNLLLTGPAGTGKTALAKGIILQTSKRLEVQKKPVVFYNIDLQRLINSGSGTFGEWQQKAYNLIQSTKSATSGVYQWVVNMIYNYNIDIEKLNKIVYKKIPLGGEIPATVPFLQNMMNIGKKLYAAGKLPEYKVGWYVDEFHQAMEIGRNGNDASPFLDMIKPDLEEGTFSIIGATTEDEYSKYVKDPAIKSRFTKVNVKELNQKQTFDIAKTASEKLMHKAKKEGHPIILTDENLNKIIETAKNYLFNIKNPRASLDLLSKVVQSVINANYFQTPEMSNLEIKLSKLTTKLKYYEKDSVQYKLLEDQIKQFKEQYAVMDKALQTKIKATIKAGGVKISNQDILSSVSRIINANPLMFVKNKTEKLDVFREEINKNIIGHQKVKDQLVKDYISKLSVLSEAKETPALSLLVGVPGTGKTETGLQLGKIEGLPTKVLAMNDYSSPASESNLFGAAKGFVGSTDASELISFVKANPFCVIVLDEVEKTNPTIMNKFLQIFEKGIYFDKQSNEEVSFRGVHFVLTSNALEEDLAQNPNLSLKELKNRLRNYKGSKLISASINGVPLNDTNAPMFSAALLSRIGDNIYGFGNLSQGELFKLVELKLNNLKKQVADSSLKLDLDFGQPTEEWLKVKAAFDKTLNGKSKADKIKLTNQWEADNAWNKYPEDSIVYGILDKVMTQGGDGRYVGKIIDADLKKKLEWLTVSLDYNDSLFGKQVKVRLNDKNEITFDYDKPKAVNIKKPVVKMH